MRHEKISPADLLMTLPTMVTGVEAEIARNSLGEDAEGAVAKAPPILQQHFLFCGRMPSRKDAARQG